MLRKLSSTVTRSSSSVSKQFLTQQKLSRSSSNYQRTSPNRSIFMPLSKDYLSSIGIGGNKSASSQPSASSSSATMSTAATAAPGGDAKPKADKKKKGKKEEKEMIDLNPPSGTRDFFPEEMRYEQWLFDKFSKTAGKFGFERYDAPVLESQILYERKAGEEITDQMYNFVDKEGYKVTLRPEMTPSLARMVLSLMREETGQMSAMLPLKWYSIPQCWRFETTQRGRKREHYQWNMDMVGVDNVTGEVELLASVVDFFKSVGLTSKDIKIKVNSRKVLNAAMINAGVPNESFAPATVIVDKLDKIGAGPCKELLQTELNLPADVASRVVDATGAETLEKFSAIAGMPDDSPEVEELAMLFKLSEGYGYRDWLVFDASVVRGLAYYTGIVFEANDRAGEFRAICGGGRYDRLLETYGGKPLPMLGYGFGDCVIMELLKEKKLLPKLDQNVDVVVCAFSKDMLGPAFETAAKLRENPAGLSVVFYQEMHTKKIGKAFNYCDRLGAKYVALVAPGEWEQGKVRIKNLREEDEDKKQVDVDVKELQTWKF